MITIYHNPKCSKSTACVNEFENLKQPFVIRNYISEPLNFEEISEILIKLNYEPIQLVRVGESIWKEKFSSKLLSPSDIIQAMVDYPILIERPIVVNNQKALIARPLDRIFEII